MWLVSWAVIALEELRQPPYAIGDLRLGDEVSASEDGDHRVTALLDRFAAAFLSVHQDENKSDASTGLLDCIDRLQGGAARGDDIVHDDNRIAFGKIAFDPLLPPVILGRFPHGEYLKCVLRIIDTRRDADAERDWIGPHRETSDRVHPNVPHFRRPFHELPSDPPDQQRSARIQRRHPCVHIKIALRAGSERERAMEDGLCRKESE